MLKATLDDIDLEAGLDVHIVDARLRSLVRSTDVGNRGLAFYLHDMQERNLHTLLGYSSAVEYAVDQLGMRKSKAYELRRAGKLLLEFRDIDRKFREEKLSWSKVKLILRVVRPENEKAWVKKAEDFSIRELDLAVRYSDHGDPPKENPSGLPDAWPLIRGEVDPALYEIWQMAKRVLQEEQGEAVSDGQMCVLLAQAFVQGKINGDGTGSVFQVVMDQCVTCKRANLKTEEGSVPIDQETAENVACQAEVVDLTEGEGSRRVDRPVTQAQRNKIRARDGHRCRKCGSEWGLQVHHIVPLSQQGKTIQENLLTVCALCHGLLHSGRLSIQGDSENPRFFNSSGREIEGFTMCVEHRRDSARVESLLPSVPG